MSIELVNDKQEKLQVNHYKRSGSILSNLSARKQRSVSSKRSAHSEKRTNELVKDEKYFFKIVVSQKT